VLATDSVKMTSLFMNENTDIFWMKTWTELNTLRCSISKQAFKVFEILIGPLTSTLCFVPTYVTAQAYHYRSIIKHGINWTLQIIIIIIIKAYCWSVKIYSTWSLCCCLFLSASYIRALEDTFSPVMAGIFLLNLASLCFCSFSIVTVGNKTVTSSHCLACD
jgi:hypothetical protein